MRRVLKVIVLVLLIVLVVIQFIKPAKNEGVEIASGQITSRHDVPENVQQILKTSCYDCHSNTTKYPWYSRVQPIAWFLHDHIIEGKKELNFSTFSSSSAARRYKKFKEIGEQVKTGEMPLQSYTLIHRDAVLTPDQKLAIETWAAESMKEMEAKYPQDSLIRKK
jgi:hypothetical protein